MIKLLTFDNLFPHYDILAKTRSRMTTATTFSRQNDPGSRVSDTQNWENVVAVLVSKSKALYRLCPNPYIPGSQHKVGIS